MPLCCVTVLQQPPTQAGYPSVVTVSGIISPFTSLTVNIHVSYGPHILSAKATALNAVIKKEFTLLPRWSSTILRGLVHSSAADASRSYCAWHGFRLWPVNKVILLHSRLIHPWNRSCVGVVTVGAKKKQQQKKRSMWVIAVRVLSSPCIHIRESCSV